MSEHRTFERAGPTCPHCGHEMTEEEMDCEANLFALAHNEERAVIECPVCDKQYWVQGGWKPQYTSAFAEEELDA